MDKRGSPIVLLGILVLISLEVRGTILVEDEDPVSQQEKDRVLELPGQSFNVSFAHYAGYVTVDEEAGRALFYWFFEAVDDPSSKPLVLWLNGGPGCSSIAFGEAEEIGPFHINPDGRTLYLNPYSWNQVANILFLDSPVGVGFSYANNSEDLLNNGDRRTAEDSLNFLRNWLKRFPQYKGRDLYIAGESYAILIHTHMHIYCSNARKNHKRRFMIRPEIHVTGHYVPQLAHAIVRCQSSSDENDISLKGYMVGNALTGDLLDHFGIFQFIWSTGLISDQTYELLNIFCENQSRVHISDQCVSAAELAEKEIGNIDLYSIYTPACQIRNATFSSRRKMHLVGRISEQFDPCAEKHSIIYFNLPEVQKALHVNPAFAPPRWVTCSDVVSEHWKDSPSSVLPIYHELIRFGLRIWMFSGDTDAVIPVTSTRYTIDALGLPSVTPWRAWYVDGQVGGWSQGYEGLTFATVRGAGHEVPLHRPKQALVLFKAFLSGSTLPSSQPHFQLHDST